MTTPQPTAPLSDLDAQNLGTQIVRAFERLRAALPHDETDLWIKELQAGSRERFTAYVHPKLDLGSICTWNDDPMAAVEDAIKQAGDRDPVSLKTHKLAQLREEAAKLEAELRGNGGVA